ncbi:hypothetical protein BLOT_013308 [Blomia tropicalis]|nr:hypothetical protein BLOT_013308 [Blomia tropicalis]
MSQQYRRTFHLDRSKISDNCFYNVLSGQIVSGPKQITAQSYVMGYPDTLCSRCIHIGQRYVEMFFPSSSPDRVFLLPDLR